MVNIPSSLLDVPFGWHLTGFPHLNWYGRLLNELVIVLSLLSRDKRINNFAMQLNVMQYNLIKY